MSDTQRPLKSTGMALGGEALSLDAFTPKATPLPATPQNFISKHRDYIPDESIDYSDLSNVNRQLIELRIRMNEIRKELNEAEDELKTCMWNYKAKKNRLMVSISGGTEKAREAAAELLCEEELSRVIVMQAVVKELQNHNRELRSDLDLLKEISNNLRRIIDIM